MYDFQCCSPLYIPSCLNDCYILHLAITTFIDAVQASVQSFQYAVVVFAVMQWKTPGTFLEDDLNRDVGEPPLAPPQVYEMYNLRTFHSLEGLLSECKKRQKTNTKCFMPVYRLCRDAVLFLLPGTPFLFIFHFHYLIVLKVQTIFVDLYIFLEKLLLKFCFIICVILSLLTITARCPAYQSLLILLVFGLHRYHTQHGLCVDHIVSCEKNT